MYRLRCERKVVLNSSTPAVEELNAKLRRRYLLRNSFNLRNLKNSLYNALYVQKQVNKFTNFLSAFTEAVVRPILKSTDFCFGSSGFIIIVRSVMEKKTTKKTTDKKKVEVK
jgi:hypothetical protein